MVPSEIFLVLGALVLPVSAFLVTFVSADIVRHILMQALEEEKKKELAKVPVKSKSKRNTRKSTGTTSSTRKSK